MSCLYNWMMIILTVCFPLVDTQAVLELLNKKPYTCQNEIAMKCNISGVACCTGFQRFWWKENEVIMTDGVETKASGKYSETVNSADNNFVLTIKNLEKEEDSGQELKCSYQAHTSPVLEFNSDDILCAPCLTCGGFTFLWAMIGMVIGCLLLCLFYLLCFNCCNFCCYTRKYLCFKFEREDDYNYKFYGKEYKREQVNVWKTVGTAIGVTSVVCVIIYGIISLLLGIYCPVTKICYYNGQYFTMILGFGTVSFIVIIQLTLDSLVDDTRSGCKKWGRYSLLVASTVLFVPIAIMIFYFLYTGNKENDPSGGNNRSKESGSSCWPPCSVGPDPNSPDPENARSLLKKKADKKNEEKPVAVVRSQPPKNRHVKTDNTESTRYSAETEIFDEGVHKSAKSRPLPSIGQPTISPRPLPQMPPSSQLEKGGIQLEPLGDSTSEKKKKKRRKKKESKQSGDED